jgi:signal transduction histidine kinase
VNQRVSKQVWTPFFATLEKMRLFRVAHAEPLHLADSEVDEFRELNATLASLVERVQNDFHTIKEFTENASHELQTPLAVIQNKVEALLQEESLSEVQMQQLDVIGQSARRMARLNHALLLLFKIGNNQFAERQSVDFKPLTEKKLRWLEDFIEEKNLRSEVVLTDKRVLMNVFLAETLVSNLLTNAVKHNLPGGLIRIHLHDKGLRIENTSPAPQVPAPELVARFARGNPRSEGVGLGLAIVQEICQQSDMHLFTEYAEGQWTAEVLF